MFQRVSRRALSITKIINKSKNHFRNPLTFSKEQMSSSILFMIREILDDSFYVLRCGHEQVNGLEFWLRVSFTCYRFNYCGSSSDQWAMDLLWYQISPYKSHFLRGYRTVEVLPLAVFANDHRPPVFSTFRAGWRISALPNTLEWNLVVRRIQRRDMKGSLLLRTIVIKEVISWTRD